MSWPLASFVLLAVALALGFAWYERSRPGSRVLALVATLAALAVAGRIAFAPLPNVKPTTDIVLLAGYVLGGAPGFAVGAVSALASNVFFGQGPWTPWQMAAWGVCGLAGAGLGAASRRRLPRLPLALCCGLAGLGFGAIMDLSTWVTFTGQHTVAGYLTIAGVSLSFNVAHAVGNVLFCLAFGPALVRALERYRERLTVTWGPAPAARPVAASPGARAALGRPLAVAVLAGALTAWSGAGAQEARADARSAAVGYLAAAQNADGGFGAARGEPTSALYSAWAAMGLVAAGRPCPDGLADVLARDGARVRATGDLERTVLGMRACGAPAGGLVRRLAARQGKDGSFDRLVNATAFAIFSLRASGRSSGDRAVRRATRWLEGQANRDGGFNFGGRAPNGASGASADAGPSGIDDTAAALQGLRSGGRPRSARPVRRAASFLASRQNPDGGFPLAPGGPSNAQSTAWAVQGLVAAGRDPGRVRRRGARSPLAYLQSLSAPDGAVRYARTSFQTPVWVTAQALTALARRPFPVLPGATPGPRALTAARNLALRAARLLG